MTDIWHFPTRVLYGEDSINKLGRELRLLKGTCVLIISDRGVCDAGLVNIVEKELKEYDIDSQRFDAVSSNPREKEVMEALASYREHGANSLVAIGGGSPIDVAKLVSMLAVHEGTLADFLEVRGGSTNIIQSTPPLIAIPTTAGTGSEVGRSAVVTLEATNQKSVVFSPHLLPDVAILDPKLTLSLPSFLTAATGFDALTHCIEAYCALGVHPMADAIARQGIELVATSLKKAVLDGTNLKARASMLCAASMGAVAFQKGLGACHALAHPLSTECNLHHGLANALCLPAVLDFNRSAVPERVARVARLLSVKGQEIETLAFECGGALRAFREKLGLPKCLSEVGVQEEQLPKLASLAFEDPVHQTNPRPCTREDFLALYKALY